MTLPKMDSGKRIALVFAAILFCFVLVRSLLHSTALMPFEGWDEAQHLAVAEFIHENGHMLTLTDPIPEKMFPFLQAHPHPAYSAMQYPGLRVSNYKSTVWLDGAWHDPESVELKPRVADR